MMVNKEVDKRLGKERKDCSAEEFKSAANLIDEVLQVLVRRLKKAQSDYKKQNVLCRSF